jgi:hypothetical protein
MNPKLIIFFLIAIFCFCCSPSVYKPTVTDVSNGKKHYADLTLAQLTSGFHLYANKCGSCHVLYKPQDISEDKWAKVLPDMKIEARLNDREYELITRYVKSKRESYPNLN